MLRGKSNELCGQFNTTNQNLIKNTVFETVSYQLLVDHEINLMGQITIFSP